MLEYNIIPITRINHQGFVIQSFIAVGEENLDLETVHSFGEEWNKFSEFHDRDLQVIGDDYFDLVDKSKLINSDVLDVGCGSGRWAFYLSQYTRCIEAIDPSAAVFPAAAMLKDKSNVRVSHASVDNIPFADNSFDLVYSLGVLHHVPDTQRAIEKCYSKVKPGGSLLLYLYYSLDNRGFFYRLLFTFSDLIRKMIYRLPDKSKRIVCDIIAAVAYWPLVQLSRLVQLISERISNRMPLSYYKRASFSIMRNDALDRFGTPLEKRFSRQQIKDMLIQCGFDGIIFSEKEPFWHVIAKKP